MAETPLIAAVRNGDAEAVSALLLAGADPDSVDEHGTPALCLAVDAFAVPVVDALVWSARLDLPAADGRTPLLRAVDRGADDIVATLVNRGAQLWLKDAEGRDALALARHWHAVDTEAGLRRRTGASGPVTRRTVHRESWGVCEELSLGGLTVRTGHATILTSLESSYGITPPFAELMERALAEPDVDHPIWLTTLQTLRERHDPAVWHEAAALSARPDPMERYFGAELLYVVVLFDESEDESFDEPLVDLLLPWAAREEDPRVMRSLTAALSNAWDPRSEQPMPALTRHPDAQVRWTATAGLERPVAAGDPEALAVVVARTRDTDATVRETACHTLGRAAPKDSATAANALAARLDDEAEPVRVTAAIQLALRDDPRGDGVLAALEPVDDTSPYYWQLDIVWRHRRTD
ncbi:HEAT repeat domain-containing protein [Streptomyces sp. SCA3-4]|uniref:ankyrin repeat domain-containing protein n=1 Tax=Streptomyces sichuanensis TaxID=2871810 RepID=UPI001CE3973B|nr:ankyrin repeat domain-containing protein [Streptomyces sichuanensis]MCA6095328.1 HEAT repeat domain-containing protein [Streptomyces sichuanensis]